MENKSTLPTHTEIEKHLRKTKGLNTLSEAEVKELGLPKTMVGYSEEQLAKDFESKTPPDWFIEKIVSHAKDLGGEKIINLWRMFKQSTEYNG